MLMYCGSVVEGEVDNWFELGVSGEVGTLCKT